MENKYDGMMRKFFDRIGIYPEEDGSLTEEELKEVEEALNTQLPLDYREFLQKYGGTSVQHSFLMPNGELGGIDFFNGIGWRTIWDESHRPSGYEMKTALTPPHFLEIGSCDGGQVFMSLAESDRGSIYFFDEWDSPQEELESNLIFVANSFDEFMELLASYGRE